MLVVAAPPVNKLQRDWPSETTMSEQDYQAFLEALARFDAEHAASPESARKVLQREGVLTDKGEVAEPYVVTAPSDVA